MSADIENNVVLRVHFLYGSKPKWEFRNVEKNEFGGLLGGHVTLQVNGYDYGFERSGRPDSFRIHVFPRRKKYKAKFSALSLDSVITKHSDKKTVTFLVPLSAGQFQKLNVIHASYCEKVPYDYAFFGMRCAASVREILGQLGILKKRPRFYYIIGNFYPKMLRKKMFRLAKERNYEVIFNEGNIRRKWEGE